MKKHVMTAVCILLAAACVCLSAALVLSARDEDGQGAGTTPGLATASSSDIQFKLALLHLYKEATDVTLVLPYTTVNLTQTAVTRAFIGSAEGEAAIREMNERVDRTLNSAFETMGDITDKYAAVLKEYGISSASSYQTKLTELQNMLASLKNASNELISRTRTLINRMNGDYDAYYTSYLEQLSDLSGKIETYGDTLENEYLALLSAISDSYETIQ